MDPERLVQCPYDKNHQIRARHFPYHLVKCKENNEKIARKLATCPYNARHRIPKEEFNSHLENCENKIALDVSNRATNLNMGIKEETGVQCSPSQEDWEAAILNRKSRSYNFNGFIMKIPLQEEIRTIFLKFKTILLNI
ncbi:Gametocyte-specific factor 1, partial [Ophiophagus hannah]